MTNRSLLIVDDEPKVLSSLKREFRREGYTVFSAPSGIAGLEILRQNSVGVVVSDYMMPEMDGISFLETVKQDNPDIVRIILTAFSGLDNAMAAVNRSQIFGYLTKPWSSDALTGMVSRAFEYHNLTVENKRLHILTSEQNSELKHLNANLEGLVQKRTMQLEEAVHEGIIMLALAAEAKDDNTGEHIYRIQNISKDICDGLGMNSEESEQISFQSIMHDVGKIHIPDNILNKPGRLTKDEFTIVKQHTVIGEKILGNKPFYKKAREIARSHHERWDGTGYPDGLKGESIPLSARVVAVADVFDALTHVRPYKQAWPLKDAIKEMERQKGKAFDPGILSVFIESVTVGTFYNLYDEVLNGTEI